MRICVIGLGYIGLPTAGLLATKGYDVVGVDVSSQIVDTINKGEIHIYEPDLDILVRSAINSKKLRATLIPEQADIFVIAVPTPFRENHAPDMSYVEAATRAIAPFVKPGNLVVLESTSPVGSTELIAETLREMRPNLSIPKRGEEEKSSSDQVCVAHCPERVLPGHILRELVENDRVVGGIDKVSTERACEFYRNFVRGTVVATDCRTAEMAKLTENSFRDVNIAFANELSILCENFDIDVWELISIANRHPRVKILQPGPGVGGHCIAVDPWFIVHAQPENAKLIRAAREVNDKKPLLIIEKIKAKAGRLKNPKVACLGLAFKPDIDDLRESPSLEIVEHLAKDQIGTLLVVEPHVKELPKKLSGYKNVYFTAAKTAIAESDIVVLLVHHEAFRAIDRSWLDEKVVIDTRGFWR